MQIFAHIRRAFFTLIAVAIFILAPTVSALTPPSCCLDGGMMNDPALQQAQAHSDDHCAEMAAEDMNSEQSHDICDSGCTGSCCSIYLSVGITFAEPSAFSEAFVSSLARPENDRSHSMNTRFPTPPPKNILQA